MKIVSFHIQFLDNGEFTSRPTWVTVHYRDNEPVARQLCDHFNKTHHHNWRVLRVTEESEFIHGYCIPEEAI